ncbi:hypothetical protein L6654_30450 [Bradyrhizobium sp. WYCCWR 13023]|uniref:Uncharacterized protein n=1 Tax=Bradyrhizobium zhengyangense TaxID=2911009 RepID=A0A9X1UDF2_9BRAD|nr:MULTISPECIES: hypothetical protein [Bradyrhizobium]MCG2630958.1 hypothetical protein [Bradyrhizobium zhengyangense]MCG2644577.1 hypothetical protein [Bradyrhizobium zhengyangense]MCG2672177.1 hypothetical protein [Bradyrhizobium zhengyangense]
MESKELRMYIEGQEILLDVLEHDGHNVEAERAKLAIEKAKLAGLTSNLRQRLTRGLKLFE